jgi:formate hydrogenlyase subunit 3/multisubunit Na+/H+ antiporter MnhD subunit
MSSAREDAPPEEPTTADQLTTAEQPTPSELELASLAMPATLRRAPRFGRFIGVGVTLGLLAGLVVGFVDAGADDPNGGVALLMAGIGLTFVGALVGALLAVIADARSRR